MVNGEQVQSLKDTGLEYHAVVSSELVKPSLLTDETIKILEVIKSALSIKLQIAHIEVQSKYVTRIIPAAA